MRKVGIECDAFEFDNKCGVVSGLGVDHIPFRMLAPKHESVEDGLEEKTCGHAYGDQKLCPCRARQDVTMVACTIIHLSQLHLLHTIS